MFGRAFWFMLLLGAAVGVPYVATEWSKLKASVTGQGSRLGGETCGEQQIIAGR